MSGYDWQPEHDTDRERAREWDRADEREHAETSAYDLLTRDQGESGENRETRFPSTAPRRTCLLCGEWFYSAGAHFERCVGRRAS